MNASERRSGLGTKASGSIFPGSKNVLPVRADKCNQEISHEIDASRTTYGAGAGRGASGVRGNVRSGRAPARPRCLRSLSSRPNASAWRPFVERTGARLGVRHTTADYGYSHLPPSRQSCRHRIAALRSAIRCSCGMIGCSRSRWGRLSCSPSTALPLRPRRWFRWVRNMPWHCAAMARWWHRALIRMGSSAPDASTTRRGRVWSLD